MKNNPLSGFTVHCLDTPTLSRDYTKFEPARLYANKLMRERHKVHLTKFGEAPTPPEPLEPKPAYKKRYIDYLAERGKN